MGNDMSANWSHHHCFNTNLGSSFSSTSSSSFHASFSSPLLNMPPPPFSFPFFPSTPSTAAPGESSSNMFSKAGTSDRQGAAQARPPNSSVYKTDLERVDAHLATFHTEEFFDAALAQNMSAKALREYFVGAGVDRDAEGHKFVEVDDMRAAYVRRVALGVPELRRRLKARGVSCDNFVEKREFEEAYAKVSRTCAICIDEYKAGDKICALPCGHTYHFKCVRQAAHTELETHQRWPRCPECRNDLNKTPCRLSSGERPTKARRN